MVDFSGWSLPVQYSDLGIIDSCLHTRSRASLFDVSHMLQIHIHGNDREKFFESITVGDIQGLKIGEGRLTVFTTNEGGIIDDSVVSKRESFLNVVLNAGCAEKDLVHIEKCRDSFGGDVKLEVMEGFGLIAIQGSEAAHVLQSLMEKVNLNQLPFMSCVDATVAGIKKCFISRSGYTGEDGFEISIPSGEGTRHIAEALLDNESVKLAGLGARDTLRIEAGLCLYGSDIDENTTPVEAGLGWTIGKRRRAEGGFPGADKILEQLKLGPSIKRVGFTIESGPPARHDSLVFATSSDVEPIGKITSGTFSPSLGRPLAIGYMPTEHSTLGNRLSVNVRGKHNPIVVTKMPFVKPNYYRIK